MGLNIDKTSKVFCINMVYRTGPFSMTLKDSKCRPFFDIEYLQNGYLQGHGVIFRPMSALNVLYAQLTRDLFAVAKFLLILDPMMYQLTASREGCLQDRQKTLETAKIIWFFQSFIGPQI